MEKPPFGLTRRESDKLERLVKGGLPFGIRVVCLAQVALHGLSLYKKTLWLALIASSLFGLGSLVVLTTNATFRKKIFHLFRDEAPVKGSNSLPDSLEPSVLPYLPELKPVRSR